MKFFFLLRKNLKFNEKNKKGYDKKTNLIFFKKIFFFKDKLK